MNQWKECVKSYEESLFEHKTDQVKDLLIEAKDKLKHWEIEQNTNIELSDQYNKEGNDLYRTKDYPKALEKYELAIKHNVKGAKA